MLRYSPLAVFLVVLLGVCAPRSAHASCGDWLQHSASPEATGTVGADPLPAPAAPCDGPLCRQSPSGPSPAPASPSSERHHHDAAWIHHAIAVTGSLDADWFVTDGVFLPVGHKMGIERPPQS